MRTLTIEVQVETDSQEELDLLTDAVLKAIVEASTPTGYGTVHEANVVYESVSVDEQSRDQDQLIRLDWRQTQNIIQTIKRYRERTGDTLRESKYRVESVTGQKWERGF